MQIRWHPKSKETDLKSFHFLHNIQEYFYLRYVAKRPLTSAVSQTQYCLYVYWSPDTSIEVGIWILSTGATNTGIPEQEVFINMLIIITFPLYWKTSATFPSLWNNWSSSFHLHLTSILLEQKLSLMNFSLLHFFTNVNYFLVELDQMCIFAQALSHSLMFVAFWVFAVIDAIYICAMEASIVLPNIFFQVIVVGVRIIHCSTSFLELHSCSM